MTIESMMAIQSLGFDFLFPLQLLSDLRALLFLATDPSVI